MRAPTVVYGRKWRHLRPAHDRWNPQKARWKSGVLFFNQVEVEDIVVDMLEVDIKSNSPRMNIRERTAINPYSCTMRFFISSADDALLT